MNALKTENEYDDQQQQRGRQQLPFVVDAAAAVVASYAKC